MKRILIKCVGFIGDHLFATSIAKKLYMQYDGNAMIDYVLLLPQPYELIKLNPYINAVFLQSIDERLYDKVFQLAPINRSLTPIEQFQKQCEVINIDSYYKIYTNESIDSYVYYNIKEIKKTKKIICWLSNWEERSFLFTEEQYKIGKDVPNLGYGGSHRNINYIINELTKNKDLFLIEVGKPNGYDQRNTDIFTVSEYSITAALLKNADVFIGAEGGLCNLAAGVGTRTIISGDFIHQLYGWNGVIEKNNEPKLGPKYYFQNHNHITLNPYLTDSQLTEEILHEIF
ncbi:MAG TPA: hypothetical protein PLY35_08245 [Thermotogota bacterium]|nr:hypothetical protein [Thermotogota bacterium]